jgi:hypothetical protein
MTTARPVQSTEPIRDLITRTYAGFNARDIDGVLKVLHPDVDWPNGMEGGRVLGHAGVRDYWTRQWTLIDPHVEPTAIQTDASGLVIVDVHQVVRDLSGALLMDRMVQHVYTIEQGLITRMDIRES